MLETEQHCLTVAGEKDGFTPDKLCAVFEHRHCITRKKKNAARIESYGERKSKHEQGRVRRWKGAGRGRGSIYENE